MVKIRVNPFPTQNDLGTLWHEAWNEVGPKNFQGILERSLAHIGAYEQARLVGFVNIAWDGGIHAFILDTCVTPALRGKGIATRMIKEAIGVAQEAGAKWLHVDFEPHLTHFYRTCGFQPTEAGLIKLQ